MKIERFSKKEFVTASLIAMLIWVPIGVAAVEKTIEYQNLKSNNEAITMTTINATPSTNVTAQNNPKADAFIADTQEEKNSDLWSKVYIITITIGVAITAAGVGATMRQKYWSDKVATYQKAKSLTLTLQLQKAQNDAAKIDSNLLNEQRLTSVERWRLRRVERAVLPRSIFVNWTMLADELRSGHFPPLNLAVVNETEPNMFSTNLLLALQKAGMNKGLITLPRNSVDALGSTSSGAMMLVANSDGERLGQMLWQKFQIGGGSMPISAAAKAVPSIPSDANCLLIKENGWALSTGDGQAGEGIDEDGRPVPPP